MIIMILLLTDDDESVQDYGVNKDETDEHKEMMMMKLRVDD